MDLKTFLENDFYNLALQFAVGVIVGFILIKYFKKRAKQQRTQATLRAWDEYDPAKGNIPVNGHGHSTTLYRHDKPAPRSNGQMFNHLEDLEN